MTITPHQYFPEDFYFEYQNIKWLIYIWRDSNIIELHIAHEEPQKKYWFKKFDRYKDAYEYSYTIRKNIEEFIKDINLDSLIMRELL